MNHAGWGLTVFILFGTSSTKTCENACTSFTMLVRLSVCQHVTDQALPNKFS
jgi:rRNA maturation protein Nop10